MQLIKASELPFDPREQISRIFVECFYEHGIKRFSRDKSKLACALAHTFILERFYTAVAGEEIMGFVGVTDKKPPPVVIEKKILISVLGFIRGRIAYWRLTRYMVNQNYPFRMPLRTASIEFVATAEAHRGKGVAKTLIIYAMQDFAFDEYVLEAVDTNLAAIHLYEKLGFKEFKRIPSPSPKRTGFNFYVFMRKKM